MGSVVALPHQLRGEPGGDFGESFLEPEPVTLRPVALEEWREWATVQVHCLAHNVKAALTVVLRSPSLLRQLRKILRIEDERTRGLECVSSAGFDKALPVKRPPYPMKSGVEHAAGPLSSRIRPYGSDDLVPSQRVGTR
jgi:hypothetical protein